MESMIKLTTLTQSCSTNTMAHPPTAKMILPQLTQSIPKRAPPTLCLNMNQSKAMVQPRDPLYALAAQAMTLAQSPTLILNLNIDRPLKLEALKKGALVVMV